SLYFGYTGLDDLGVNRGELSCRTLLLHSDPTKTCYTYGGVASYRYDYDYYLYVGVFLTSYGGAGGGSGGINEKHRPPGGIGPSINSATRQIVKKQIRGLNTNTYEWTYTRAADTGFTNPRSVTIKDALQNETVYYYHATAPPANPADPSHDGSLAD